jgi:DNA-binding response OmpR family regulator
MRILVADDDPVVREVVRRYLERDGSTVVECAEGDSAIALLLDPAGAVDLAVLDVMMPGSDGVEICRAVRGGPRPDTPLILLTALGDEDDRILGLSMGADDYVTKPFSPRELALRVSSLLRRSHGRTGDSGPQILRDADLEVNPAAQSVLAGGRRVDLTAREFNLLLFLLRNRRRVFSREDLLAQVWGWDFGDLSTVTVHIKRLRAKLGAAHRIETVWGRGYRWGRDETEQTGAD